MAPADAAASACLRAISAEAAETPPRSAAGIHGTADMSGAGTTTTSAPASRSSATVVVRNRQADAGGTKRAEVVGADHDHGEVGPQRDRAAHLSRQVGRLRTRHGDHGELDTEALASSAASRGPIPAFSSRRRAPVP